MLENILLLPMLDTQTHREAIISIQSAIYPPHFHEDINIIMTRRSLWSKGSFIAIDKYTHFIHGYGQCYPWSKTKALIKPPSLGSEDATIEIENALKLPSSDVILFIHEISLYTQGKGIGRCILQSMFTLAKENKYSTCMLVSVLGNESLWKHVGQFISIETISSYAIDDIDIEKKYEQNINTYPNTLNSLHESSATISYPKTSSFYSNDVSATVMIKDL